MTSKEKLDVLKDRQFSSDNWYTLTDNDLEACVKHTKTADEAAKLARQTHKARISLAHGGF